MRWSAWIWLFPAIGMVVGLAVPWLLVLSGLSFARPEPMTLVTVFLAQAAILAFSWHYLKAVGFWLICMTRRNRNCLHDTGDAIWYLDPSVLTFAKSAVVKVEYGRQSTSTHALEIFLHGRPRPVTINARHFEGGVGAVMAFLAPTEPVSSAPTSGGGPWG